MSDIVEFLKKNWIFVVIGLGVFLYFSLTESERDSSGNLIKAGWLEASLLRVGDCIGDDVPPDREEVGNVWATPCSQEHTQEVFYIYELQNKYQSYPGEELVTEEADNFCSGSFFNDFVGLPYEESIYEASYYFPLPEGWDAGDTRIQCLIYDPSKETSRGSKRNTKR